MAGQILPRGPRKWLVRVYAGSKVVNGKRKRTYTSAVVEGTYAAAKQKVAALTTDIAQGTFIPPATQSFGQYVEWWLRDVVGARAEGGTARSYRARLRFFIERGGHLRLDQVNSAALQSIFNLLVEERGWSPRTCGYARTLLRMAFSDAVRLGLVRTNAGAALLIPRTAKPIGSVSVCKVWDAEQVRHFLESTEGSPWHPLWHILLNTGVRPQEAVALQWSDLRGSDLSITRALKQDAEARWLVGAPKTAGSVRTIMLPLGTVAVLRKTRNGVLVGNMWGQLAGNPETGVDVPTIPLLRRAFERAVKQAKLPDIGLYGLRHTHATLCLTLGVPIKVVSERLGHAKVQITMDTYQHVLPHMQEEVAAKLESALGG